MLAIFLERDGAEVTYHVRALVRGIPDATSRVIHPGGAAITGAPGPYADAVRSILVMTLLSIFLQRNHSWVTSNVGASIRDVLEAMFSPIQPAGAGIAGAQSNLCPWTEIPRCSDIAVHIMERGR